MVITTTLGFPRIGPKRELKAALEAHWAGKLAAEGLHHTARCVRQDLHRRAAAAGLGMLPVGDFALYDHVLDMALTLGAVPARFDGAAHGAGLDLAFAMARGDRGIAALEMTKWFDTNYHYLVPELDEPTRFGLAWPKQRELWQEASAAGHATRAVLLGPLTFLTLAKVTAENRVRHLDSLLDAYAELLADLAAHGVREVQLDEPALVADLPSFAVEALPNVYERLRAATPELRLWLTPYFGGLDGPTLARVLRLPIDVLHLDLVRAPLQLDAVLPILPTHLALSLGLVDGRNIWVTDLGRAIGMAERAAAALGSERIAVATSCSLLHVPYTAAEETDLDPELRSWLAFMDEKLAELTVIGRAVDAGRAAVAAELDANRQALESRRRSARVRDFGARDRAAAVTADMARRRSPYPERRRAQQDKLHLPLLPATTIGSFPQTLEVRRARTRQRRGEISAESYEAFLRAETEKAVRLQEELGLDVLVHGEFERTDMVEYFGQQLAGFAFTRAGWVQSYGSRCVKPPIIYGDVARPHVMTVAWSSYAQSLTGRPVKGMLTGPVTILQWSFVRDDQPRSTTCRQIALAIRDEVQDLERAGIGLIQIDEPALREGLPLRREDWAAYLAWAGECFRIAASGVADSTQIHTHMCYAEFNDIIAAIAELDADVISIETTRSQMALLEAFSDFRYPNEIGPGVWDIHSPRVPEATEMAALLRRAAEHIPVERLWVNPDCGLKTRGWEETRAALANLVQAARDLRTELAQ